MTSVTIGWFVAATIAIFSGAAGWFGREKYDRYRAARPRAMFTPPAPPLQLVPPTPLRRVGWGPVPMPGERKRMAAVDAHIESRVADIDQQGRHHVEVVTTHAMPVVQEHPS